MSDTAPEPRRYGYRVVHLSFWRMDIPDGLVVEAAAQDTLNALFDAGWRLVSVVPRGDTTEAPLACVFVREKVWG